MTGSRNRARKRSREMPALLQKEEKEDGLFKATPCNAVRKRRRRRRRKLYSKLTQ